MKMPGAVALAPRRHMPSSVFCPRVPSQIYAAAIPGKTPTTAVAAACHALLPPPGSAHVCRGASAHKYNMHTDTCVPVPSRKDCQCLLRRAKSREKAGSGVRLMEGMRRSGSSIDHVFAVALAQGDTQAVGHGGVIPARAPCGPKLCRPLVFRAAAACHIVRECGVDVSAATSYARCAGAFESSSASASISRTRQRRRHRCRCSCCSCRVACTLVSVVTYWERFASEVAACPSLASLEGTWWLR